MEIRVNARGLSNPGPRMMVEIALARSNATSVRVVVSDQSAVEDLKQYFSDKTTQLSVEDVGEEFHLLATLANEPCK